MVVVETSVDTCPRHLVIQSVRIFESVSMDRLAECAAVDDEVNLRRSEVPFKQIGDRPGHAAVSRRVFGMAGGHAERRPLRIRHKFVASAAGRNRGGRTPKIVTIFRIPTSDGCISKAGPNPRRLVSCSRQDSQKHEHTVAQCALSRTAQSPFVGEYERYY